MVKTIGDLKKELEKYSDNQLVCATWEGILKNIEIYESANKIVLIDADRCLYKDRFQKLNIKEGWIDL